MAALFPDTPASSSSNCSFSDDDSDYYSESKPDVPLLESKYTISPSKKCVKGSYSKQIVKNPRIGAKRPQTSVATTNEFAKPSSKKKRISISGKTSKHDDSVDPVWKWWEEDPLPNGVKWKTLEHEGPLFPPPYEPLPISVKFYYGGEHIILSPLTEEIAGFYSRMLDHDYTKSDIFNKNFFHDWRKYMTKEESSKITNLQDCDFSQLCQHFKLLSEMRKLLSKQEKQQMKIDNNILEEKYGYCVIDGHKQKVGNYRIEPPGLFRGRGDHPKQGRLKLRIQAEDVIINIGKNARVPSPPISHTWKKVQHDAKVTWLACWIENITGNNKYIMLNSTSRLKGEKDWQKYETARKLKKHVSHIREDYFDGLKSREMFIRQRSVALYLIDRLALRAGNEKDSDEEADTVGCCSLRVEHVKLYDEIDGSINVVEFDFLGKDSIRYKNRVPIDKQVFKNIRLFIKDKEPSDELFDRLTTSILNKYLHELMEGLTAKVFRTYNASITLQMQLNSSKLSDNSSIPERMLVYNRSNRAVALLCNHQRAIPKSFSKQMDNIQKKIDEKEVEITQLRKEYKESKKFLKQSEKFCKNSNLKKINLKIHNLDEQLHKLKIQATDKEENKQIALGTSKLNYLDPRISVAWCKKYSVPIEKVYNKTLREKFAWAMDMADRTFEF
ncbi:DNA topoisomerase I, mitochondrial-like [Oopsacas minuta]|uniref:DNA topoisomerase I n=1 Tax=Oopsacas minuta TaxID=111878 RepID=A0AAV7JZR2_9METZ|nr:DNA topoisomerase I, mitochondrial-like [Oopsacas minuta]